MMKLLMALLAAFFLVGGAGAMIASAQDGATPEDVVAAEGTNPVAPKIGDTITVFDGYGEVGATITVTGVVRGWEDYDESYEPSPGYEYVAFTVTVESMFSSALDIETYDFSLQTVQSSHLGPSNVPDNDIEPPMLEDRVSLGKGDSAEFTLVFTVSEGEELAHIFWAPNPGLLYTLAQLDGE